MSALDLELRETALEAVQAVCDAPLTYTRPGRGTYVPGSGMSAPADQSWPLWGIPGTAKGRADGTEIVPGTLMQVGDMIVTAPAGQLPIEPEAGDRITLGGIVHAIVAIRPQYGTEMVVQHELLVRRG